MNGVNRPERVAAIMALIGDDPRIVHLDSFLSRDEAYGLIAATDAYVSLHRAEGLGLGLAEAMALGKPVIGTGYSGNLEFMNEGNSLLVDYRIVPVAPGEYLVDDERFVWADPDIDRRRGTCARWPTTRRPVRGSRRPGSRRSARRFTARNRAAAAAPCRRAWTKPAACWPSHPAAPAVPRCSSPMRRTARTRCSRTCSRASSAAATSTSAPTIRRRIR